MTNDKRHIILATFGTDGDVFPFIGLGAALRRRSHRVTLVTSDDYCERAREFDLEFQSLNTCEEAKAVLAHPDFWHPLKGPAVGARWGVGYFPRQYELFAGLAADPNAVFVTSPAVFAARMAAEKFGRPVASVVLQPWMIASTIAPPVFPLGMTLPRWAPWPGGPLYWLCFDVAGHLLIGRALNRFRRTIGLPAVRVFRWWLSPQLTIGMFPPVYGPPQADWPRHIKLTGFPLFDGHLEQAIDERLAEFCRAGEPPIAFTFGTGMRRADHLFHAAVEAVRPLNARAVFLTRFAGQLPANLPSSIYHAAFAPFGRLFPLCGAVVHHGGVGTICRALSAGIPQLVLPIAYDQKDNAIRVKRLGAGDWLAARRRTAPEMAAALRAILTPQSREAAHRLRPQFTQSGLDASADLVEKTFHS